MLQPVSNVDICVFECCAGTGLPKVVVPQILFINLLPEVHLIASSTPFTLKSTKTPSANQQAADYIQAGIQGKGFRKMASQSAAGAPGQSGAYYRPRAAEGLPTVTECPGSVSVCDS